MSDLLGIENSQSEELEKTTSGDMIYKNINGTTYEVVSNYVGKNSLLDIVKCAIRRDIENGNY